MLAANVESVTLKRQEHFPEHRPSNRKAGLQEVSEVIDFRHFDAVRDEDGGLYLKTNHHHASPLLVDGKPLLQPHDQGKAYPVCHEGRGSEIFFPDAINGPIREALGMTKKE